MRSMISLKLIWLMMIIGNVLYYSVFGQDWHAAAEHSFFEGAGILAVYAQRRFQ